MVTRLASVSGVLLLATAIQAQFTFDPATQYGALSRPSGMTSADFNGDTHIDLATTSDNNDRVVLFQNATDANFASSVNINLPASSSPQDLIAGDFNGDMIPDLAVALRDPAGSVRLLLNNGAGGFTSGGDFAVGDRPRGLSMADLDGDNDLDLAVANRDSDSMSLLRNTGSGTFTVNTISVGAEPRDTTFGNFLPDTGLEIAVTNHDDRTISILDDVGGNFTPVMTLNVGAPFRPEGITTADLNNDGLDDLAVAIGDPDFASVYLNTGTGMAAPVNYATGGLNSSDIRAGDLNCDGFLDLVVSNSDSGNISVLANNQNGTFTPGQLFNVGSEPSELTLADMDGDGDLDIAVANTLSNNISVLINTTCTITPPNPDFNGDGALDCADVDSLVAAIVAGSNASGFDLTGDGSVDTADLDQWLIDAGAANLASGNPYLAGDANLDGLVDGSDFLVWNSSKFSATAAWCSGDFNADGTVDGQDFLLWNQNKFTAADPGGTLAVPEASGWSALLLAFLALAGRWRRQNVIA